MQCNNKKDGRTEAADVALRILMAEGEFSMASGMNPISYQVNVVIDQN